MGLLALMRRWTSRPDWDDGCRFVVILGGVLACSLGGFAVFQGGGASRADWLGKIVFDAVVLAWLVAVGRGIRSRLLARPRP
jgi:hypothetical protein